MTRLLIIMAAALILAAFIDIRDQAGIRLWNERKEIRATLILGMILALFCGTRVWGNDTVTYLQIYGQIPLLPELRLEDIPPVSQGVGFYLLTSVIKTLNFSNQDYLMFYAFLTVIPYTVFVHRFSSSMKIGVYLMFATGMFTFTMAAIKQCMATGICLMALPLALDRKWGKYILLMLLSASFHPYSLVYLLVPFMMFKPWSIRTLLYVGFFLAVGFYLDTLIGTVLDITTLMGAAYTDDAFSGEGVNIFRVAVAFVPLLLAMVYGKPLFRNSTPEDDLMFNLAMLNALIMFVGLFGTANYFARLANYFLPAQVIVVPWLINKTAPIDRAWLKPACIVAYLGYFYYEYGIVHPFDAEYSQISVFDYFADLLGRIL